MSGPEPRSVRWAGTRALLVECVGLPDVLALHAHLAAHHLRGQLEATGAVEPASRGEVLRRSVRLVDVEPSDSIVPPSAFDVMRERLLNATVR